MIMKFPAARIAATFALVAISFSLAPAAHATGDARQKSDIERGRYLVTLGGCNDCHTTGYPESGGQIPEAQWLTGSAMGYKGPWGTTYASNLRTLLRGMTADQWVQVAHTIQTRPPMPWFVLHQINEGDLRAMHAFITSLGPSSAQAPAYLPPGQEPTTPYVSMPAPPRH